MDRPVLEQQENFRDNLTLGVVSTLEKMDGVEDVIFYDHGPSDSIAITSWEQRYSTTLPSEIKNFYLASDGFKLSWSLRHGGQKLPNTGCMLINRISDLRRVAGLRHSFDTEHPTLLDLEVTPTTKSKMSCVDSPKGDNKQAAVNKSKYQQPQFGLRWKMFELDGCRGEGKVLLVFPPKPETFESIHITFDVAPMTPQVWFLDKAFEWHFLAPCFTTYFRMMLVHLGLPQWQTLFTDIGPTPWAKQVFNLIAPHLMDAQDTEKECRRDSMPCHVIDPTIFKLKSKSSKKAEEVKGD